jgi:hypothetical protein
VLTVDTSSETWQAVSGHCRKQCEIDMTKLAEMNVTERDADFLRGRINLCTEILALKDMPPKIESTIINNF